MLQFCLWLMLALRWLPRENGLLAVFLLVCDMPAPASYEPAECVAAAAAAAQLLLLLLLWLLAEGRRWAEGHQRRENQDLPARIALHALPCMHAPPSTHQHERKIPRTKNCTPRKNYAHPRTRLELGTPKN
jgi:hypothetical protein